MEKKGEILNQLAIISDLLENINFESETISVIVMVKEKEFNDMFSKLSKKTKTKPEDLEDTFSLKIGEINFVFNKNNV